MPVQADQSLGEIICRACANDKDARYQSAEEFLKVLETWEYGGKDSGYNNNGGNGEGGRSHTQFQQDKKSYADSMWQYEEDDETRGVFGKDRENSPKKSNASESKINNNQSENHYNAGNSAGAAAVQNDHGEENLQKKKQPSAKKRVKGIVICGVVFILMGTAGIYLAKNTGNNSEITPTVTPEPEFELEPELVAEPVNELEYTVDQTPSGVSVLEAHGVYVATANLNVRQDCTMAAERVGTVPKGTILESTGVCENGWIRVIYNSETAYVSGNYVRKEE